VGFGKTVLAAVTLRSGCGRAASPRPPRNLPAGSTTSVISRRAPQSDAGEATFATTQPEGTGSPSGRVPPSNAADPVSGRRCSLTRLVDNAFC
jgi:hypothetical protein